MKKFTLVLGVWLCSLMTFAQSWTLQNTFTTNMAQSKGIEYDGTDVWVYSKGLNVYVRYSTTGSLLSIKQFIDLSYSGDFTYDGSYFYTIKSTTSTLYKYDLNSAATVPAATMPTNLPTGMNFVAYDSTANSGQGGLWIGGGSNNIYLSTMTGVIVDSILSSVHGLSDLEGAAVDNITPGGPYLWTITGGNSPGSTVTMARINLSSGLPDGVSRNLTGTIAQPGQLGGGLFIASNLYGNTVTLGGVIQQATIFMYDLSTCSAEPFDLEIKNIHDLDYPQPNSSIAFGYTLKNHGTDTVHSVDIALQVDNISFDTISLSGLNLAQFDTLQLRDTMMIQAISGQNEITAELLSINGGMDSVTVNNITQRTFKLYDLALGVNYTPKYFSNTQPVRISADVWNRGITTVSKYHVNYSLNGGPTQIDTIQVGNLYPGGAHNFAISFMDTIGTYQLNLWLSNPNDSLDQYANNHVLNFQYEVYDTTKVVARVPLMEMFTSSTCAPCAQAAQHFQTFLPQTDSNWTLIKYQMNWPGSGDPYYTSEGGVRRDFYNVSGVPDLRVNGNEKAYPVGISLQDLQKATATPAFVEMNSRFSLNGHRMNVDVIMNSHIELTGANVKLFVAVVERETHNNVGTNGETEFHYVMKKMMDNAQGTAVSLGENQTLSKTFSYEFPGSYRLPSSSSNAINLNTEHSVEDFQDLVVLTWLQDMQTKKVLQSAWSVNETHVGLTENNGPQDIRVYPNPSKGWIAIETESLNERIVSVQLLNSLGQQMDYYPMDRLQKVEIPVDHLKSGMYLLKVETNQGTFTKRVMVQ